MQIPIPQHRQWLWYVAMAADDIAVILVLAMIVGPWLLLALDLAQRLVGAVS